MALPDNINEEKLSEVDRFLGRKSEASEEIL